MAVRAVLYIMGILFTIYLFFILDDTAVTGILILEILYPATSWFFLAGAKRNVDVHLGFLPDMGEKGQKISGTVTVKSRYRLPVRGKIFLAVGGRFSSRKKKQVISVYLPSGKTRHFSFDIQSGQSGSFEVELVRAVLWDYLGVFCRSCRIREKKEVGIWPEIDLMPLEVTRRTREFPADADEYSPEKSGDDPSQVYRIREYTPQDPARSIHWKISSKEDRLMVKEYSFPLGAAVLLWIDFRESRKMEEDFDRILQSAASLSLSLAEEKCVHMAAWFEERNRQVIKRRVDSEESFYELIWRMMEIEPVRDSGLADVYYEEAFRGIRFSTVIKIDNTGDILVNGSRQELIQV